MYFLTTSVARVRNISVTIANGAISLTILLIAPMGLFAVIVNTLLIMAATYGCLTVSDRVIAYLQREKQKRNVGRFGASRLGDIASRDRDDLDR